MPVVKYNENIVDLSKLEIYYGFGHDVKNFFSTVEDLETFLKSQNDGFCILATVVQVPTCGGENITENIINIPFYVDRIIWQGSESNIKEKRIQTMRYGCVKLQCVGSNETQSKSNDLCLIIDDMSHDNIFVVGGTYIIYGQYISGNIVAHTQGVVEISAYGEKYNHRNISADPDEFRSQICEKYRNIIEDIVPLK